MQAQSCHFSRHSNGTGRLLRQRRNNFGRCSDDTGKLLRNNNFNSCSEWHLYTKTVVVEENGR